MSDQQLPIRLRKANQEDVSFIFNSWLRSYKHSLFARPVTNTIFYAEHHKIIERLLKTNQVVIACNDNDPSQIYGFICGGHIDNIFCLHYIYVKHSFRSLGVGKALLNAFQHNPSTAAVYTHHTRWADKLGARYNLVYHPYLLFDNSKEAVDESQE